MTPLTPPPLSPLLDAPRPRPRGRRAWFAVLFVIVLAGGVAATAAAISLLRPGTLPGLPGASAGPGLVVADPVGVRPNPSPGPDLGESWATPPDPDRFVTIEDGTRVADDQYLVMLEPGATADTAQRLADSVHGTIAGHIAYLDLWTIATSPVRDTRGWYDMRDRIGMQQGVAAISPVSLIAVDGAKTFPEVEASALQALPPGDVGDCATPLSDAVYGGDRTKPYDMIGVRAAWNAFYASGLPKGPVHLGITDTELTHDPRGRIGWEFGHLTFVGDPAVVGTPVGKTASHPGADGFHHADGVLGIIAADPTNGGIAGIASPLGDGLMVTHTVLGAGAVNGDPRSRWRAPDGTSYTSAELLNVMYQIEHGATIINGSWGPTTVSEANTGTAAMWKRFFDKMAIDHPDVLFVYAAGNEQSALDGSNSYPGGIPAPNVITVGNVTTGNKRVTSSNGLLASTPGGEVTLGAPGQQAVWGIGVDGKVRANRGGTSSAAPMVSAAAILIRAIDPTLTAAEIKQLIAETAAPGDPEVGGRTLRVDLAVRKAIDRARARRNLPLLDDATIAAAGALCRIDVRASLSRHLDQPSGAAEWAVTASVGAVPSPTSIALVSAKRPPNWQQPITAPGATVTWAIEVGATGDTVTVTRLDNGYWTSIRVGDGDGASPTAPSPLMASPGGGPTPMPTPTSPPAPSATPAGSGAIDCSEQPPYYDPVWYLKCS